MNTSFFHTHIATGLLLYVLLLFIPISTIAQETTDDGKKLITTYFEQVWNQGNLGVIEQVTPPVFILHYFGKPDTASYDEHKAVITYWRGALPDYTLVLEDVLSEGNKVAARFSFTGTHKDTLLGIPPTGNTIRSTGMWMCNVENNLLQECWEEYDIQSMMSQLQSSASEN